MGFLLGEAVPLHQVAFCFLHQLIFLVVPLGPQHVLQPPGHLKQHVDTGAKVASGNRGRQRKNIVPQQIQQILSADYQHGAGGRQIIKQIFRRLVPQFIAANNGADVLFGHQAFDLASAAGPVTGGHTAALQDITDALTALFALKRNNDFFHSASLPPSLGQFHQDSVCDNVPISLPSGNMGVVFRPFRLLAAQEGLGHMLA